MLEGVTSVLRRESLLIPVFLYGLVKLVLPVNDTDGDIKKIVLNIIRPVLALILTVPLFILLCLCGCYFEIVKLFAKLKYRSRYVEHFLGADAVWSYDQRIGSSVFNVFLWFEDQGLDTPEKCMKMGCDVFKECMLTHPRFSCIRKSFMGYFFFVKENIDIDQVYVYLDDYKDYKGFMAVLNALNSKPMPYDGKYMLQTCVGKTVIEVEPGRFVYPVVIRAHHSLMDGVTMLAYLLTMHIDDGYNVTRGIFKDMMAMFKQNSRTEKNTGESSSTNKSLWKQIWDKQVYFHHNILQHVEPVNSLHNGPISTKKLQVVKLEGPNDDYFHKVKEIRRKLNVTHSDVVLGAVAASLTEYYAKHEPTHPTFISTGTTFFLNGIDFDNLVQLHGDKPIINMGNKFTVGHSKIPLDDKFLADPRQFVRAMHQETSSLWKALDMLFFYWLLNINCTIVPEYLASPIMGLFDCTAITTNVPGVKDIYLSNGMKIVDTMGFSINYKQIGVCIGIYTFNNRFRITLNVDRTFIKNEEQGQAICDNFFKYIDRIYESVK